MALVHDSAPYERRGQAISVVQFVLVVSFAFIPTIYAKLMPSYEPELYTQLVLVSIVGAAFFWFFSVLGEEQRGAVSAPPEETPSFIKTFSTIWTDIRAKRYAIFLGASAFFAFMQDAVLEPFGGDVFHLAAGETTRFNAYWGVGVLAGMIGTMLITRRWRPEQQVSTTAWGLVLLGLALSLLGLASLSEVLEWVMPILIFFGLGFGIFTVGGVSLLMAMSKEKHAGSYLALWSVIQLVSRGAGIAMGGVLRDLALLLTKGFAISYALVFGLEAMGIFACVLLLQRADVLGFAANRS
jgi:BCD family chlorophyll transporter-like MFS transporter